MPSSQDVVVVGAGIVGAATAFELQRRGFCVTLVDRDEPGRGASYGNMASIAVTEFMPVSRPSTWARMPGWLLNPEGPIRVRPGYLPKLLPWFLRFIAAGRPSRLAALESAGAALCRRVYQDLLPMLEAADASHMLSTTGCLSLYADDAELKADEEHLGLLEQHGLPHESLGGPALRELEPSISPQIRHGVLFAQNRTLSDPYGLVLALTQGLRARGGKVERGEVSGFDLGVSGISGVRFADGRRVEASQVVLCAGAHTGRLSRMLGEPIPLETERGYHTQIMSPGIELHHALIWPAKAFMVSPTAGGIRVGGTVEMAGLEAPPDYRRARVLVRHAQRALPGLRVEQASEWMGHRPALPDTIPVIGRSQKVPGVYYATGHGHLGVTYSATTARIIADLATDREPPVDIAPYRVDRF